MLTDSHQWLALKNGIDEGESPLNPPFEKGGEVDAIYHPPFSKGDTGGLRDLKFYISLISQ